MREAKGALKKDERYVLYLQLYVQDYSNFLSNQFVRILVCDAYEKKNTGFFRGIKPEDILKKKEVQEKVKDTLKNLLKFNVWVEAAIEITENGYFVIRDTEVNEY